jgi:23S rRNA (cytidine1920-2'-O)/16S rRNA (cytidine1409-2'-O)-methyltransferase
MTRTVRVRLDELLLARGLVPSRSTARGLIMAGQVLVEEEVSDKAGALVRLDADVRLRSRPRFVSRGGDKLAHALDAFGLEVTGAYALVDCLLQSGADRVIALDVGRGQLHSRLSNDPRVYPLDRINARYLTPDRLAYVPDVLTMDVSFISVTKVLPAVVYCMAPVFSGLVLIKPQFEAGPDLVGSGGIVRDPAVHRGVLLESARFVIGELDAQLRGMCRSALLGADGNAEFFLHLGRGGEKGAGLDTLEGLVDELFAEDGIDEAVDTVETDT